VFYDTREKQNINGEEKDKIVLPDDGRYKNGNNDG